MFKSVKSKVLVAVSALGATIGTASAAVPTEATDAITALGTDATAMTTAAWPILASITGGFIVMKLFKRAANKAT